MSKGRLEKILFIPDAHVPYEDKDSFRLMLKAAKAFKPDHAIILGDFIDCYSVSSHSRHPDRSLKLREEVGATIKALEAIKEIGAKNNVFVAGNHEDRLERYLKDKAPELFHFISIPKILMLKDMGFKYVPYKQSYRIGKMNVTHDCGNAGRFAHYKSLDTFQHNVIIGHTHRLGYAVEGNAQGERHVTAMFGWLGDVEQVDYMHRVKAVKDWTQGFGLGHLDVDTGIVYLTPVPIIKNTCLVEGKLISL